jgi:hypothetical protein
MQCRQPLGALQRVAGPAWQLPGDLVGASDVDGDGFDDVIGLQASGIGVRYGEPSGNLSVLATRALLLGGSVSLVDINKDQRTDILLPILSGFAGGLMTILGQPQRSLLSVAYSPFQADGLGTIVPFLYQGETRYAAVLDIGVSVLVGDSASLGEPLPLGNTQDDVSVPVITADFDSVVTAPPQKESWVVAYDNNPTIYIYEFDGVQVVLRQSLTMPNAETILRTVVADFDGNGRRDILTAYDTAQGPESRVAFLNPATGLLNLDSGFVDLSVLEVGDFDLDGAMDFALPLGITTNPPLEPLLIEAWAEAEAGDFNGDGNLDLAAVGSTASSLDIYLGNGAGLFNKISTYTPATPSKLRTGDFDGDFYDDIAFVMPMPSGEGDELAVSYGGVSGPRSFQIQARPGHILHLHAFRMAGGLLQAGDATDDIVIVSSETTATSTPNVVSIQQGTSDRGFLSPFIAADRSVATLGGEFAKAAGTDVERTDVCMATITDDESIYSFSTLPNIGARSRLDRGNAVPSAPYDVNDFDIRCTAFAVADLDGNGIDEVIGFDHGRYCRQAGAASETPRLGLITFDAQHVATLEVFDINGLALRVPTRIQVHDYDGDSDVDIVVGFIGDTSPDFSGVAVFANQNGQIDTTPLIIPAPPGGLLDIATIHLSPSSAPSLLMLSPSEVLAIEFDPDTQEFTEPRSLLRDTAYELAVADINGDGVDDVALSNGRLTWVYSGVSAPALGDNPGGAN